VEGRSVGGFIQFLGDLIGGAGDPNVIARMLPDSSVWPHYLALSFRSYRLPEYFYWIGLGLVLLGFALGVLSYFSGRVRLIDLLLRFSIVSILWQLTVVTPAMVGCKTDGVPCVLSGEWRAERKGGVEGEVAVPVLDPGGNITVRRWQVQVRPTYQVTFNPRASSGQENDRYLSRQIKGAWSTFNRLSNQALFRELARQQKGIAEAKRALNHVFTSVMVGVGAGGAISALANYISGAGPALSAFTTRIPFIGAALGPLLGATSGYIGAGLEAVADTATRLIQGLGGTLVTAMLFGPVALLTMFHSINTLSGVLVYLVLFSAPILLGIAAMGQMGVLANAFRVLLLALFVPLITGPVFGMAFRVIYGGYGEEAERLQKLSNIANALVTQNDRTRPFRYTILSNVASAQLAATYACAKAMDEATGQIPTTPPYLCPETASDLVYRDYDDYKNKVLRLYANDSLTNLKEVVGRKYANVPALLYASGDPKSVVKDFAKKAEAFFGQGKDGEFQLQNVAVYSNYMSLIRAYRPAFVWGWGPFIEAKFEQLNLGRPRASSLSCDRYRPPDDDPHRYEKAVMVCLKDALLLQKSDQLEKGAVKSAFEEAKKVDSKLNFGNWERETLTYNNEGGSNGYPPGWFTDSSRMGFGPGGLQEGLEPEAPLYAIDAGYISLLIAKSLPEALMSFARSSWMTNLLAILLSLVMSFGIIAILWGVLGQLIGVAGNLSAEVSSDVAGFLAGSAAVSRINLYHGVPSTTNIDRQARSAGERARAYWERRSGRGGYPSGESGKGGGEP
jgi:hypothetical protein